MTMPPLRQRFGTVRDNQPFYALYLARRNSVRSGAKSLTGTSRVTEDNKSRATEDGQPRGIET